MLVSFPLWAWALLAGLLLVSLTAALRPHWLWPSKQVRIAAEFVTDDPAAGVLFAAGVVLIAVPTFFTMFPSLLTSNGDRWGIFTVWSLAAVVAGIASAQKTGEVDRLLRRLVRRVADETSPDTIAVADQRATSAAPVLLDGLLENPAADLVPVGHEFMVYTLDGDSGSLVPAWVPRRLRGTEVFSWPVGIGATGQAWLRERRVVATGDEVWNSAFSVPEERVEALKDLVAVAAAPVYRSDGTKVAVLSVYSLTDEEFLVSPEGQESHLLLAACVGLVLEAIQLPTELGDLLLRQTGR